jgi:hypothetical protein
MENQIGRNVNCVGQASGDIVSRAEVVQSMRVGGSADLLFLGSQYRNQSGELHWYIALLLRGGAKIRQVLSGELPEGLDQDEREATVEAIWFWESQRA